MHNTNDRLKDDLLISKEYIAAPVDDTEWSRFICRSGKTRLYE